MPDFQGNDRIIIQPGTFDYPYEFEITKCSAAGANDGFLPSDKIISTVDVTAWKHGTSLLEDTELIASDSFYEFIITVRLSYPSTNGRGRYKLKFILTLDDGSKEEVDFGRIIVKDR